MIPYSARLIAMTVVAAAPDRTRERRWHIVLLRWSPPSVSASVR